MVNGVYCLVISLDKSRQVRIGKLGLIDFKKGYYCYVGSALNGLEKRIERHKRKEKKLHWHIDYLLKYGKIIDTFVIETNKKIECLLSKRVEKISDGLIEGFGCSDCKCSSHLYYFDKKPDIKKYFKK